MSAGGREPDRASGGDGSRRGDGRGGDEDRTARVRRLGLRTPWSEIERTLSDRPRTERTAGRTASTSGRRDPAEIVPIRVGDRMPPDRLPHIPPPDPVPEGADGSDAPAWSRPPRSRGLTAAPRPPEPTADPHAVTRFEPASATSDGRVPAACERSPHAPLLLPHRAPFAELHVHSDFSFLDGASEPEELVAAAADAGLTALGLTDHNGFYGAVRFAQAAAETGMPTVFGSELSVGLRTQIPGQRDPESLHLLLLARSVAGYRSLSALITAAHLRGEKNRPVYDLDEVLARIRETGDWILSTGCRKGPLLPRLADPDGGLAALAELRDAVGAENLVVELSRSGLPEDDARVRHLADLADRTGLRTIASSGVHYARRSGFRGAQVRAAVRARSSLDGIAGWLPPYASARIRSGEEMLAAYPRRAVFEAARIGAECAFELRSAAPELPDAPVPLGLTDAEHLRRLTIAGAHRRYGTRAQSPQAWAQLDSELATIEAMGFCGYFLIVWDIARFCREQDIFCQGRGSAANSAVCYVLGITAVDAVRFGLLFDRFLTPEREGYPDIDVDIESGRREEVIQYVYDRYGRERAAQVADVITYRAKSAIRDAASALGFDAGQQDAFSKGLHRFSSLPDDEDSPVPQQVRELAADLLGTPRHLGIHSGGMILADRPIGEVVPVERARMPGRTIVQWDKDDCAAMDLVKFDLLGLGMLTALHESVDLIARHTGERIDRAALPQEDPAVFDMLCAGDAIGVFQIESRAQLATLPRMAPRTFYDLAVQVALIRPGPIQGGSVHPYIRRRQGLEEPRCAHPLLERSLSRTLGIPLFQEQLMQMAIDVGGFTGAQADSLRRAMGSRRSEAKMRALSADFLAGAAERGVPEDVAVQTFEKIAAFANYGFPESHAISFANLVYDSAWLKRHHHAAFTAGLLRAQPMGFYSPQSLIADARRHGVTILPVCVAASQERADLEAHPESGGGWPDAAGGWAIRLGLDSVRGAAEAASGIVAERASGGPFASPADLARRTGADRRTLEALAAAGAFACFGLDRREALWAAGAQAGSQLGSLPLEAAPPPPLPGMSAFELTLAELATTGVTVDGYPTEHLRAGLAARGCLTTEGAARTADGTRITVGGVVTHRQRPSTASGITFLNLEDETGMLNVVCSPGLMRRFRTVATSANLLAVTGILQRSGEVVSLLADRLEPLAVDMPLRSRDFR